MTLIKTINPIISLKVKYVYKEDKNGLCLTFMLLFWICLGILTSLYYSLLKKYFPILEYAIVQLIIGSLFILMPYITFMIRIILQDLNIIESYNIRVIGIRYL